MKVVDTDRAPAAIGPYSQGIVAGQFLFVSGQTPLDPATEKLVDGGIKEQTKRALDNIVGILEAAGTGLDKVVKVTVYLEDMNDFAAMNEVYAPISDLNSPHDAQLRSRDFPKTQRWR